MEQEREFITILELLGKVIEVNKGIVQTNEKFTEAEFLATKFFFHCASSFYLSRGTIVPDFPLCPIDFIDAASINVVARASVESFLVFHYVFSASISEEEADFRFYSWQLGGLKERGKYLPKVEILKQQAATTITNDKKCIQKYEQILQRNNVFLNLSKKKQNDILNGKWRTESWREIALDAGLSEMHAEHFYRLLCGYAHSSSLSTLQLSQADTPDKKAILFGATMGVLKIAMSNLIFEYCKLFPKSKEEIDKHEQAKMIAENWIEIGQKV